MSFLDIKIPQDIFGFPKMSFMDFKISQYIFGLLEEVSWTFTFPKIYLVSQNDFPGL